MSITQNILRQAEQNYREAFVGRGNIRTATRELNDARRALEAVRLRSQINDNAFLLRQAEREHDYPMVRNIKRHILNLEWQLSEL